MNSLPKDGSRYGILLIVLFAIAALATRASIDYISPLVAHSEVRIVTLLLCSLTFGLMLISGAFAVWAIRFSAEAESLRRLGSVVDAMTYIKDGVLALDRQGHITGMNPTARNLLNVPEGGKLSLSEVQPELSETDLILLLQGALPEEIECTAERDGCTNTFRYRSQPSKGATLLLVSDVTKQTDTRTRHRRAAYLQLIGHIAQGVANDFNNLLCGISGHASLISRSAADVTTVVQSAEAITSCANRGIHLAGRLLEISASPQGHRMGTQQPSVHANAAVDALAADLSSAWTIIRSIAPDVAPVNLPGVQLEHIIHGLGLLAADTYDRESTLSVQLSPPQATGTCHTPGDYVGFVMLAAGPLESIDVGTLRSRDTGTIGLIESVAASMLLHAGGRLDCFSTPGGTPVYRVCLPPATASELGSESEELPLGLEAYIANWRVLISSDLHNSKSLQRYLENCSVTVESASGIVETISRIERGEGLCAIVLNAATLGEEREGLLRAVAKLCPLGGIVVVGEDPGSDTALNEDIVSVPTADSPTRLVRAMIEARTLARTRENKSA
jgi:PAS domain-containing protein